MNSTYLKLKLTYAPQLLQKLNESFYKSKWILAYVRSSIYFTMLLSSIGAYEKVYPNMA